MQQVTLFHELFPAIISLVVYRTLSHHGGGGIWDNGEAYSPVLGSFPRLSI